MPLYTNCEKFHCSMARGDEKIDENRQAIALHLSITKKPKYPIISRGVDICELGLDGVDICPMWLECSDSTQKTKPAKREE